MRFLLLLPLWCCSALTSDVFDDEGVAESALAADGQCDTKSSDCAMRMMQLRGQKVMGNSSDDTERGSCQTYGCGGYHSSHSCQCNANCHIHGNCCGDYSSTCGAGSSGGSCSSQGCKFVKSQACQCNAHCSKFGDCCADYSSTCAASTSQASCQKYGCGKFVRSQTCQCNAKCSEYHNCCSDYHSTCSAPTESGSCRAVGCGKYEKSQACQCNAKCTKYGNCCSDYKATCKAHAPGTVHGHPSATKSYPTYKGFTLMLAEEFDKPIDLDSDPIWTWSDGGLIEGQIRYVKEGIKFEDGKMKVSVGREHHKVEACSHAETAVIPPKVLSSGEMRTKHNMFRYGRYEASIRAPEVQPGNTKINGNYIATMFVFRDGKFKHWREIDIEITGNTVDSLHTNVLSADDTPEWNADMGEEGDEKMGTNVRSHFNTYAIEWLPYSITWFFNGKVVRKKKGGKIPIPKLATKIMMNLWVFDEVALFGGKDIKNNRYPMHSEYDWFRFYKWDGDKQYPCAGMGTQCLTADDRYLSSNNPCDGIPQEGTVYGKAPCKAHCHR